MKSTLKNMVLVLFTITAVSAFLVALVNYFTKDTIAATNQAAKDKAKLEVLPAVNGEVTLRDTVRTISNFEVRVTEVRVAADSSLVGYAVEAPSITRGGYADRITLMVGFVEQGDSTLIHGVKVLSQKETPGLGANMTKRDNKLEASIMRQPNPAKMKFEVKKVDPEGSFDALTGSTISSRAYANAVETAYAGYLRATGQLDETKIKGATAVSGATNTYEDKPTNEPVEVEEPEAQKGDVSNE